MDAGGHLRAWEDNDSTTHSPASHLPKSNQKSRMAAIPSVPTPNSTTFHPHNRTLPSLSTVFESTSIRSASNHYIPSHDPDRSYFAKIKTSNTPDQGLKRPRLSQDQGRRVDGDISRGSSLGTIPVSPFKKGFLLRIIT